MRENKLYACIVYTLYNIFKDDNIKAQIIINDKFKKLVIKQICNLLTLEKEYDACLNCNKFTLSFAQVLVNITNKSEIIEKIDNVNFDILDQEYVSFVQYIVLNFNVEKNYIIKENFIDKKIIDKTSDFIDKKILDNIFKKIKYKNNKQKNNKNYSDLNFSSKKNNDLNSSLNNNDFANFNDLNINKFNMSQIIKKITDMPIHPRLDPRFYFYTSKPKYMPILKKIIASFAIFSSILLVLLWFLNSYLNIHLNTNVIVYKIPKTSSVVIIGGGADSFLHNNNNNFSEIFSFGSKYKFLLMQSAGLQTFSAILSILPGFFLGYELLGKKRFPKDIYVIRFWPVILSIIILFYSSLSLIQVLLPNIVEKYFNNISVPNSGYIIKNDPQLKLTEKLLPDSDLDITIKNLVNEVYNNKTYRILRIFTIISMIVGIISGIMVIILVILAPKINRNKLMLANIEYKKAVNSILNGQKYEIDSSLFDDEFNKDNIIKKDDFNNEKSKK